MKNCRLGHTPQIKNTDKSTIQYNTIQLYCLYVEKFAFWLVVYIKTFNTVNDKTSTTHITLPLHQSFCCCLSTRTEHTIQSSPTFRQRSVMPLFYIVLLLRHFHVRWRLYSPTPTWDFGSLPVQVYLFGDKLDKPN